MTTRFVILRHGETEWNVASRIQGHTDSGLTALGRTSATFQQAIFFEGRCVSTARAINVLIDWTTRKPVVIPDAVRANFARWRVANIE